ncbi:MAG TPA: TIGR00730 family Rossman fold protein [Abditibacterium sp.]|jgi:hypothetical protein
MKRIAVYCGSNLGARPDYASAALSLAQNLFDKEIELVFGGTDCGTMGILAHEILRLGGRAIGVVPQSESLFQRAQENLSEIHIVASMHERKLLMAQMSDGFIALPGGLGTLDEFFEAATWSQLKLHQKPCGLLNVAGFYDDLLRFLDGATREGMLKSEYRAMILSSSDAGDLIEQMRRYEFPEVGKWIE